MVIVEIRVTFAEFMFTRVKKCGTEKKPQEIKRMIAIKMLNVCGRLLLLFELIAGDVIDANGDKSPARKQTLRANKSDQVTPPLDFGVLELRAYLERKTSPALVLANARDAFCHGSHHYYGHRENLIIRDRFWRPIAGHERY